MKSHGFLSKTPFFWFHGSAKTHELLEKDLFSHEIENDDMYGTCPTMTLLGSLLICDLSVSHNMIYFINLTRNVYDGDLYNGTLPGLADFDPTGIPTLRPRLRHSNDTQGWLQMSARRFVQSIKWCFALEQSLFFITAPQATLWFFNWYSISQFIHISLIKALRAVLRLVLELYTIFVDQEVKSWIGEAAT